MQIIGRFFTLRDYDKSVAGNRLIAMGLSVEQVVEALNLSVEEVRESQK